MYFVAIAERLRNKVDAYAYTRVYQATMAYMLRSVLIFRSQFANGTHSTTTTIYEFNVNTEHETRKRRKLVRTIFSLINK